MLVTIWCSCIRAAKGKWQLQTHTHIHTQHIINTHIYTQRYNGICTQPSCAIAHSRQSHRTVCTGFCSLCVQGRQRNLNKYPMSHSSVFAVEHFTEAEIFRQGYQQRRLMTSMHAPPQHHQWQVRAVDEAPPTLLLCCPGLAELLYCLSLQPPEDWWVPWLVGPYWRPLYLAQTKAGERSVSVSPCQQDPSRRSPE